MQTLELTTEVKNLVSLLVNRQYDEVEAITRGDRLKSDVIESAINDYGRTLVEPPESAYSELLDVVQIAGQQDPTWSVRMPLWSNEEGRSDLTLDIRIAQRPTRCEVSLYDIRVL